MVVTEGLYISLLGINWLTSLGIELARVNVMSMVDTDFSNICEEFPTIFGGALGLYSDPLVFLQLDPAIWPIHLKAQ